MANKSKIRGVQYAILVCCALVFVVCAILLVKTLIGYAQANSFYDQMTLDEIGQDEKDPPEAEELPARVLSLMASYRELKETYPNIKGYINIPALSISYPVGQWTDNEYYEKHLISGEENNSGSIFLDFRIASTPMQAKNLILYGHNMNDKSMFNRIRDLFEEDTFYSTRVEYICDDGVFIYDSLAIYVTYTDDPYYAYTFRDDATFDAFFRERAGLSWFPVEYEKTAPIITLVTCSNSATKPNQRFVYQARLTEAYTEFGEES